jgi:hypothetical protein
VCHLGGVITALLTAFAAGHSDVLPQRPLLLLLLLLPRLGLLLLGLLPLLRLLLLGLLPLLRLLLLGLLPRLCGLCKLLRLVCVRSS